MERANRVGTLLLLVIGIVSLILFYLSLDRSQLAVPLDQHWPDYIRRLLILFVLPVSGVIYLIYRFRNQFQRFWFQYGVPASLIMVISVWAMPSLLSKLTLEISNGDSEIPEELAEQIDEPEILERTETPKEEAQLPPPPMEVTVEESTNSNRDTILHWFFGILSAIICVSLLVNWVKNHRPSTRNDLREHDVRSDVSEKPNEEFDTAALIDNVNRVYAQLLNLAEQQFGARRQASMTPLEFQTVLTRLGIPGEPVAQITDAFQSHRYGRYEPSAEEFHQLVSAIRQIEENLRASQ